MKFRRRPLFFLHEAPFSRDKAFNREKIDLDERTKGRTTLKNDFHPFGIPDKKK